MDLGGFQAVHLEQREEDRLEVTSGHQESYLKAPLTPIKTEGRSVLHAPSPFYFPQGTHSFPACLPKSERTRPASRCLCSSYRGQWVLCKCQMNEGAVLLPVRPAFLSPHWRVRPIPSIPSATLLSLVPPWDLCRAFVYPRDK